MKQEYIWKARALMPITNRIELQRWELSDSIIMARPKRFGFVRVAAAADSVWHEFSPAAASAIQDTRAYCWRLQMNICERCEKPQAVHITTVSRGGELSEAHLCEFCARSVLSEPYPPSRPQSSRLAEVPVEVERVVISEVDDHQLTVFREVEGDRRLSFVLGIFEASGIDRVLKRLPSPRPLTHDAWLSTIVTLGVMVQAVCIHDRRENTYFAEVRLDRGGELVRVDVRPSDGLTLALKAGAPVLIADRLLAEVSVPPN